MSNIPEVIKPIVFESQITLEGTEIVISNSVDKIIQVVPSFEVVITEASQSLNFDFEEV